MVLGGGFFVGDVQVVAADQSDAQQLTRMMSVVRAQVLDSDYGRPRGPRAVQVAGSAAAIWLA